jgi:putative endonuclease
MSLPDCLNYHCPTALTVIARLVRAISTTTMPKQKQYWVYIITNKKNGSLYIGVTSDLVKRIWQHKQKLVEGFSSRYNLTQLVYLESYNDVELAIRREKRLKKYKRQWKINLIEQENPEWNDLYQEIIL